MTAKLPPLALVTVRLPLQDIDASRSQKAVRRKLAFVGVEPDEIDDFEVTFTTSLAALRGSLLALDDAAIATALVAVNGAPDADIAAFCSSLGRLPRSVIANPAPKDTRPARGGTLL